MVDLAVRTQGAFQALLEAFNSLPFWIAIVILFAPTFVSLFTRKWVTIASTSVLNTACLTLLATGQSSSSAGPLAIVTFSAALIIALFGLHERQLWQNLSGLERRLGNVEEQMMTFLTALERRSDMIDQRAEEARRTFEAARKPPQLPTAAFPTPPQAARTGAPEGAHRKTDVAGTTPVVTTPIPPTTKT
jgi:Zn-dependent protease with chaperone function